MTIELKMVYTGSKSLDRLLNALGSDRARELSRDAMRPAVELIAEEARRSAPRRTGALAGSIVVRAMPKRTNGRIGFTVQQRAGAFKGQQYYGSFLELGYMSGRRRDRIEWRVGNETLKQIKLAGVRVVEENESGGWVRKWRRSKPEEVFESRRAERNPRRKIEGIWFMRDAALTKEQDALTVYYEGLGQLIEAEAKASGND